MEDTVSDIYNKLILKLDEKYDELPTVKEKEIYSKYSTGEPFLRLIVVNFSFIVISYTRSLMRHAEII